MTEYSLKEGIIVSSSKSACGALAVKGGEISGRKAPSGPAVDLQGMSFVYPALINTHDHLRGNYLPRVGPSEGKFYLNWLPWDNDLKASACYAERTRALDIQKGYLLSAYKNLFSGVVTVNDHFPHKLNAEILPSLPIRAIQNYAIEHECSSYDLKWGAGIQEEHDSAVKNGWPFITHLSEGFDDESMDSISRLENLGALDNHCLFVHCIAFSDEDIRKCAAAGASISWCAASNMFMFNTTCKIKKFIEAGVNVTIGTDSSHTGSYNLFEEIKYGRSIYRAMYGEDLSPQSIFNMVTLNAAKAFWMDEKTGSLDTGKYADILVLKAKHDDAYENLCSAGSEDIELLVREGKPLFGEMRFIELLNGTLPEGYTVVKIGGRDMFVAGDPLALYRHIRSAAGVKKTLEFLPFEPDEQ
ncbi:MAG: amidohydrolase family protein [Spirochaetaceae bacterium]|nr:amidohydrolase family protein [Spirochaetaceae bacterium]